MGPSEEDGGAPANVTQILKVIIRKMERVDEMTEEVRFGLFAVEKALQDRGPAPAPAPAKRAAPPEGPAPAVHDFRIEEASGGSVVATFDNAKQVTLTRTLAELAIILASDEGESPDELVAWKSFERVGELLLERLGRKFSRHAISQLLLRLRKSLMVVDSSRRLVQSVPQVGARLRLKRGAPTTLIAG